MRRRMRSTLGIRRSTSIWWDPWILTNDPSRFIRELKDTCLKSKPGNKVFWDKVRGIGRPLSYISESEATKAGGKSTISESEAQQV